MSRILNALVAAALLLFGTACIAAASDQAGVKTTLRQVIKAANAGDAKTLMPLLADSGVVIDEFAPFRWEGTAGWLDALGKYDAANGVTGAKTTLGRFDHVLVDGGQAYAVVQADYTYREGGKARKEHGTEVYGLDETAGHWRVHSFAWFSKDGIDEGADATAITALIQGAFDAVNAGKPDPTAADWRGVIDEFPPFHWQGTSAASGWLADFLKSMGGAAPGVTIKLAKPTHLSVNGDAGYVVFPTGLTLTLNGKATHEAGTLAYAVQKSGGAWHVVSWAWARK